MSETDKQRRARLIAEIDASEAEGHAEETVFYAAASRFARAMYGGSAEELEAAGLDLAELVYPDPLGPSKQRILVTLFAGGFRAPPTRPPLSPTHPDVTRTVKRLRQLEEEGWPRDAAVVKAAEELKVDPKTVCNHERIFIERENAIETELVKRTGK